MHALLYVLCVLRIRPPAAEVLVVAWVTCGLRSYMVPVLCSGLCSCLFRCHANPHPSSLCVTTCLACRTGVIVLRFQASGGKHEANAEHGSPPVARTRASRSPRAYLRSPVLQANLLRQRVCVMNCGKRRNMDCEKNVL